MTRRRWRLALLAAVATIAAIWPITTLFKPSTWFLEAAVVVGGITLLGILIRGVTRSRVLVVLAQLVVAFAGIGYRYVGDTLNTLIPTAATGQRLSTLAEQALETIQKYSAPAPLGEGVTFFLLLLTALIAVAVDALAATWVAPAAAGLPLLTAYLVAAANGNEALEWKYFVLPVLAWLLMLHVGSRAQFGRWNSTTARAEASDSAGARTDVTVADHEVSADRSRGARALSYGAVRIGIGALALALALPVLIPHFPTRYLTEGLGTKGGGSGEGRVGFNDTLDLSRSLTSSDPTPVLTYTTTGPATTPLRVLATSYYSRGQWLVAGKDDNGLTAPAPLMSPDMRSTEVMTFTDNEVKAPRLAAPYPVTSVAMPGVNWTIDPVTRDIQVSQTPGSYRVSYSEPALLPVQLQKAATAPGPDVISDDTRIPDTLRPSIEAWADEVTKGKETQIAKAVAIQDHLRNTSLYTYSLDLGAAMKDESGRFIDPLEQFRLTRRGYCTQFASAMIMMARAEGIPARMAIGYLPGTFEGGSMQVRQSDAHAWPELYFSGYGWLRFEPTPGDRSGRPPSYAVAGGEAGGSVGGRPADDETESSAPTTAATAVPTTTAAATATATPSGWERITSWFTWGNTAIVLAIVLGLLAAFSMPLTAWWLRWRRRRRAANRTELIEGEWSDLTAHLDDLGLSPPPGGTLRRVRDHYLAQGHFGSEEQGAMNRVTATLETSRYNRPERTTSEDADRALADIAMLRRHAGKSRSRGARFRSFMWPTRSVRHWRDLPRRIGRGRARD